MKIDQKYLTLLDEVQRRRLAGIVGLRLCFEILTLASAIDADCATRLAPHRLSEGKFVLLFILHQKSAGLSPHELAERAGVTRATITGLLDGMERDGLLSRHHDLEDRRKIAVRLTSTGAELAATLFNQHATWIASLMADLTDSEQLMLSQLLGRIWQKTSAAQLSGYAQPTGSEATWA